MQSSSVLETAASIIPTVLDPNKILSDELLTAFHPLVKLPLPYWAQQVHNLLKENREANPNYSTISVCFNQTALLEFNFGRTERAFKLCYAHLEWLAKLISKTGNLELAVQAFDPWLNLGRLERLTGKYEASLERFELLSQVAVQNEVVLGPLTLTNDHWQAIVKARPDIDAFVRKACLTDVLKTLLKSKQYQTTLELIRGIEDYTSAQDLVNQNLSKLLIEAKFISLCRLARNEEALELIELDSGDPHLRPGATNLLNFSFCLHWVEALAISNKLFTAQHLAQELAQQTELFNYDKEPRLFKIAVTLRLAKLLEALGLDKLALPVAKQGYTANLAMQDEIFEAEFLKLLVHLDLVGNGSLKSQSEWQTRLEQLGQTTCYTELKKRLVRDVSPLKITGYSSECSAILDELSSSLFSFGD